EKRITAVQNYFSTRDSPANLAGVTQRIICNDQPIHHHPLRNVKAFFCHHQNFPSMPSDQCAAFKDSPEGSVSINLVYAHQKSVGCDVKPDCRCIVAQYRVCQKISLTTVNEINRTVTRHFVYGNLPHVDVMKEMPPLQRRT